MADEPIFGFISLKVNTLLVIPLKAALAQNHFTLLLAKTHTICSGFVLRA